MNSLDFKIFDTDFQPNPGSILLGLLNQIKHTAISFAHTYRLDLDNLRNFLFQFVVQAKENILVHLANYPWFEIDTAQVLARDHEFFSAGKQL